MAWKAVEKGVTVKISVARGALLESGWDCAPRNPKEAGMLSKLLSIFP